MTRYLEEMSVDRTEVYQGECRKLDGAPSRRDSRMTAWMLAFEWLTARGARRWRSSDLE